MWVAEQWTLAFPLLHQKQNKNAVDREDMMKLKQKESLRLALMIISIWGLRYLKLLSNSCWYRCFWFTVAQRVLQCSASAMGGKKKYSYWEVLSRQTSHDYSLPVLMKSCFDVLEFQHRFSVFAVVDVPCSSERPLQGNQASVRALLLAADCNLSRPLLWTRFCALVPLQVWPLSGKGWRLTLGWF